MKLHKHGKLRCPKCGCSMSRSNFGARCDNGFCRFFVAL